MEKIFTLKIDPIKKVKGQECKNCRLTLPQHDKNGHRINAEGELIFDPLCWHCDAPKEQQDLSKTPNARCEHNNHPLRCYFCKEKETCGHTMMQDKPELGEYKRGVLEALTAILNHLEDRQAVLISYHEVKRIMESLLTS